MKPIQNRLFSSLLFSFILFYSSYAQKPATPDLSINYYSTFNSGTSMSTIDDQGRIIVVGSFTKYKTVSKKYITRIFANGDLDESFNSEGSGPNNYVNQVKIQSNGKIIIAGGFTSYNNIPVNNIARLNSDGSLDNSFHSPVEIAYTISLDHFTNNNILLRTSSAKDTIVTILDKDGEFITNLNPFPAGSIKKHIIAASILHPSEKVILAISYNIPTGPSSYYSYSKIICLNIDGSIDNSFNSNITSWDGGITEFVSQDDGKILMAGYFSYINGSFSPNLIRLSANGMRDLSFNYYIKDKTNNYDSPFKVKIASKGKILVSYGYRNPCCPNNYNDGGNIYRLNEDGSKDIFFKTISAGYGRILDFSLHNDNIYINGEFKACAGVSKSCFAICYSDGSNNDTFYAPAGVPHHYQQVTKVVSLPDGRMMASGFTAFGNKSTGLVRLNADGSFDKTFAFSLTISSFEIQQDGKILTTYPIKRINSNGTLDNTFVPAIEATNNFFPQQCKIQANGKILVFGARGGNNTHIVMRLNNDGSLDNSFKIDSSTTGGFTGMCIQKDNKILVYGLFTKYGNKVANKIIRLNDDGTIDGTFNPVANTTIRKILVLENGRMLVAGSGGIKRLNSDGSEDLNFTIGNGDIFDILKQKENHFIVCGSFNNYQGASLKNLAMIDSLGNIIFSTLNLLETKTSTFYSLSKYDDERFLLGGNFSNADSNLLGGFIRCYTGIPSGHKKVSGKIFNDVNGNCKKEGFEKALPGVIIKASGTTDYFGFTNGKGEYVINIDTSVTNFRLTQIFNTLQQLTLTNQCAPYIDVNSPNQKGDTCCFNFYNSQINCSILSIDISNSRRRRCARGMTNISYSNRGNMDASNVKISVEYSEYLYPIKSEPQWTSRQGNFLYWDLTSLTAGTEGRINIIDSVICGKPEIVNLTQCVKATITPLGKCIAEKEGWDKSSVNVTGECSNNTSTFTILNTGTGDMSKESEYRVFMNDTLIYSNNFQLLAGADLKINVESGGNNVRLEADQHPDHPGKSYPRYTLEACGGTLASAVRGLVTTNMQDDKDENIAISCGQLTDSYDPNDKTAQPTGFTSSNFLLSSDKIEYTIRFQNTGSDDAYKVVIVDTLDQNLDLSTLLAGASSHDYTFMIEGITRPVLRFTFDNIKLPTKTADSLNSNGSISFSIYPFKNLSNGTVIQNHAAIYFDYNTPVITNTVTHTIHDFQVLNLTKSNLVKKLTMPTITSQSISSVTISSAVAGGNISDDGGAFVTARGVCWSTSSNPTIANNKTNDGTGMGDFTSYITELFPNTTYYVRAYAINNIGIVYGNEVIFTTSVGTGFNLSLKNNISIYPNPGNGSLTLTINSLNSEYVETRVLNSNGALVYNERINNFNGNYNESIDLSLLPKGFYTIQIITSNGIFTDKLIISD
jgi:uncharacterized delta-60 repeat protein/uncharacterized repeat protein (TIGR01451 family)